LGLRGSLRRDVTLPLVEDDGAVDVLVRGHLQLLGGVRTVDHDGVDRRSALVDEEPGLDHGVGLEGHQDVARDAERRGGALGDHGVGLYVEHEHPVLVAQREVGSSRVAHGEAAGHERAVVHAVVLVAGDEHGDHHLVELPVFVELRITGDHGQVEPEEGLAVAGVDHWRGREPRHGDRAVLRLGVCDAQLFFRAVGRAQPVGRAVVEGGELGVPGVHLRDLLLGLEPVELVSRDEVLVLPRGLRQLDGPGERCFGANRGRVELRLVHVVVLDPADEVAPLDAGRRDVVVQAARALVVGDLLLDVLRRVGQVVVRLGRTAPGVRGAREAQDGGEGEDGLSQHGFLLLAFRNEE